MRKKSIEKWLYELYDQASMYYREFNDDDTEYSLSMIFYISFNNALQFRHVKVKITRWEKDLYEENPKKANKKIWEQDFNTRDKAVNFLSSLLEILERGELETEEEVNKITM